MSIAVFFLDPATRAPGVKFFGSAELIPALAETESLRNAGMRHVAISSELEDSVGKPGVNDKLPEGYDWSKAHRGAGPERK